jgi:hypothetical protein
MIGFSCTPSHCGFLPPIVPIMDFSIAHMYLPVTWQSRTAQIRSILLNYLECPSSPCIWHTLIRLIPRKEYWIHNCPIPIDLNNMTV